MKVVYLYWKDCVLLLPNFKYLAFQSFDLSVPDEGYPRNASCALNLISTFLLLYSARFNFPLFWQHMYRHLIVPFFNISGSVIVNRKYLGQFQDLQKQISYIFFMTKILVIMLVYSLRLSLSGLCKTTTYQK